VAFIVFGLSPTGLFLIQQLSKTKNQIYSIDRKGKIGFYSKYGEKYEASSLEEIQKIVISIVNKSNTNQKIKAFITTSEYLNLFSTQWPEIFQLLDVVGPSISTLDLLNKKSSAAIFFQNFDINTPKSYSAQEAPFINKFPIIAKWDYSIYQNKLEEDELNKTKIIKDKQELLSTLKKIQNHSEKEKKSLLFQQFLNLSVFQEIGYGAYFENGKVKMDIIVNQFRQYPMGVSSYAFELTSNKHVKLKNRFNDILESIGYNGFIEIDFLFNEKTNEIYFLDANPRAWGFIKILTKKYKNFYECITNDTSLPIVNNEKVYFIDLQRDFIAIAKRQIQKPSLRQFINDFKSLFVKNLAINNFELKDPKPFFIGAPLIFFKNIFRKK
jgi:predicted ATP-grasp superfamily ATP-dependent carboligase